MANDLLTRSDESNHTRLAAVSNPVQNRDRKGAGGPSRSLTVAVLCGVIKAGALDAVAANSFISSSCCRGVRRCADQRACAFAAASWYVPFQVASTSLGEFILVLNVPLPVRPLNFPLPPVN